MIDFLALYLQALVEAVELYLHAVILAGVNPAAEGDGGEDVFPQRLSVVHPVRGGDIFLAFQPILAIDKEIGAYIFQVLFFYPHEACVTLNDKGVSLKAHEFPLGSAVGETSQLQTAAGNGYVFSIRNQLGFNSMLLL